MIPVLPEGRNSESCADSAQPKYQLFTAADALEQQTDEEWVIDQLFLKASVNMVAGVDGSKKTWAMLDAAVCVAQGAPWLGRTTAQGPVLIIDEESGKRRLARRLKAVIAGHSADGSLPLAYTSLAGWNLREQQDVDDLDELMSLQRPALVIIDALADAMLGGDENSVKDVMPVFAALRGLSEKHQAAIVVIHHHNKSGGYRGSTSIAGALDLSLAVVSAQDSLQIHFESVKVRDMEPLSFDAEFRYSDKQVCLAPAAAAKKDTPRDEQRILDFLRNGPQWRQDIMQSCGQESAKKALPRMVKKGSIAECKELGPRNAKRFRLAVLSVVPDPEREESAG